MHITDSLPHQTLALNTSTALAWATPAAAAPDSQTIAASPPVAHLAHAHAPVQKCRSHSRRTRYPLLSAPPPSHPTPKHGTGSSTLPLPLFLHPRQYLVLLLL